jgi:hypothetical protein
MPARADDGAPKIHLDGGRQLVNVTNAADITVLRFDAATTARPGPSLGGAGAKADLRFGSDGQAAHHRRRRGWAPWGPDAEDAGGVERRRVVRRFAAYALSRLGIQIRIRRAMAADDAEPTPRRGGQQP